MIFLQVDLSQAENRVELMLTRDPEMIRLARTKPWEFDMHTYNAAVVCNKREQDITKEDRYLGKTTNHAFQRGIGADTMQGTLLKGGVVRTEDECRTLLQRIGSKYAPIKDVYFPMIRKDIVRYRALANSWGRIIRYDGLALDDQLFQDAYSFLPQSEVADLINQWGVIPAWKHLHMQKVARLHLQVHDSLLLSVQSKDAWDVADFLQTSLVRPRTYFGETMVIPCSFALGRTWAMEREWNQLPSRAEFVLT